MSLRAAIRHFPDYHLEAVAVEITDRAVHKALFARPYRGAQTPERIRIMRNWLVAYRVLKAVPFAHWDPVATCCLNTLGAMPLQGRPGAPTGTASADVEPPFRDLVVALHGLRIPNHFGGTLGTWAVLASKALWLKYPEHCFLYDKRVARCVMGSMKAPIGRALAAAFGVAHAARGKHGGSSLVDLDTDAYVALVDALNVLHGLYHTPPHLAATYPTLTSMRLLDKLLYYWNR